MSAAAVLLLLAAGINAVFALPTCTPNTVQLNTDKIVIAAIGDWGRVGSAASMYNEVTVQGCRADRECCSSIQNNNFPDDFDCSDISNAPQQMAAASLMDEVCGTAGCQAVLGLGDNFYPCGADAPASGLNRFNTDWAGVYIANKTNLQKLKWYQIVGNHDYGFNNSVARQVNYSSQDSQWVLPERYYSTVFEGNGFSFQVAALDATPFVSSYTYPNPNYAYYHNEYISAATPEYINSDAASYKNSTTGLCTIPPENATIIHNVSDSATGQVPWLKSCLSGSKATWTAIQAHFALWGSDQEYGNPNTPKYYPGMCGAWGTIANLVNQYKPAIWINGHDHTMTHADPQHAGVATGLPLGGYGNYSYQVTKPGATQYFTFGNGGALAYGDGVTPESPKSYNNFTAVVYNNNQNGSPGEGFGILTITKCNMTVDMYSYIDYAKEKKPVHSVFIPGNC